MTEDEIVLHWCKANGIKEDRQAVIKFLEEKNLIASHIPLSVPPRFDEIASRILYKLHASKGHYDEGDFLKVAKDAYKEYV